MNPGERIGDLVLVEPAAPLRGRGRWLCLCDCGATCVFRADRLRAGEAKSCGCARRASPTADAARAAGVNRSTVWRRQRRATSPGQ